MPDQRSGTARRFSFFRRPRLADFGTNALIAELAERGDLALAVSAYQRAYGTPDSDVAESERAWSACRKCVNCRRPIGEVVG